MPLRVTAPEVLPIRMAPALSVLTPANVSVPPPAWTRRRVLAVKAVPLPEKLTTFVFVPLEKVLST